MMDLDVWGLSEQEKNLLKGRLESNKLGFALSLKYLQNKGFFPESRGYINDDIGRYVAGILGVSIKDLEQYDFASRSARSHRKEIRKFLSYRPSTNEDAKKAVTFLIDETFRDFNELNLLCCLQQWYRDNRIELPVLSRQKNLVDTAIKASDEALFTKLHLHLKESVRQALSILIEESNDNLSWLKSDPGRASLETVLEEVKKLNQIRQIGLPDNLIEGIAASRIQGLYLRASTESAWDLRRHPLAISQSLLALFCHNRKAEIIDSLGDLIVQLVHKVKRRAEKKVKDYLIKDVEELHGKSRILFKMADAALQQPDGIIREVMFPLVDEETLEAIVKEYKSKGPGYVREVQTRIRQSWNCHYRRMLYPILSALNFRSNNAHHQPVIQGLLYIKELVNTRQQYIPIDAIPLQGIVPEDLKLLVIETDDQGEKRINRIHYELCLLQALREKLRCKEIWIEGGKRYCNPEQDVPQDFSENRQAYYNLLDLPLDAETFIAGIQKEMRTYLKHMNDTLPKNGKVSLRKKGKNRICLTPLDAQPEPEQLRFLKKEIGKRWPMTNLLDVLKETELRVNFTKHFKGLGNREILERPSIQHRTLLCLYGLGTNMGLKPILSEKEQTTYEELLYIKRRYFHKDALRAAIADIANAVFDIRKSDIWGEATMACASDSKKFGAWDQNLLTEWHIRYHGRGVMIYWHVEKNANCIYSQLTRCSASEASNMIKGVLNHCTKMSINKQYVDTHGQSEVAFAFCRMFGFELMPRLKNIAIQKLSLVDPEDRTLYPHLEPILHLRSINWDIIRQNYDEIVKYAVAMKIGIAQPEDILRRFTEHNIPQHPTYKALSELGKAIKTIFLCRYLSSEELRREIQEGLNVVENWNSANAFIFYGKNGEIAANQLAEQEISVLCLHLLQICMVYINTLMIQEVLKEVAWLERMKARDRQALTPLIYFHINPYGAFLLNMDQRIQLTT